MSDDTTIQVAIAGAAATLGAAITAGASKLYEALRPTPSDTKIAELERRVGALEQRLHAVDDKLDTVRENLGYVRGALAQVLGAIREDHTNAERDPSPARPPDNPSDRA